MVDEPETRMKVFRAFDEADVSSRNSPTKGRVQILHASSSKQDVFSATKLPFNHFMSKCQPFSKEFCFFPVFSIFLYLQQFNHRHVLEPFSFQYIFLSFLKTLNDAKKVKAQQRSPSKKDNNWIGIGKNKFSPIPLTFSFSFSAKTPIKRNSTEFFFAEDFSKKSKKRAKRNFP